MADLGLAIVGAVDTGLRLSFGLYQLAIDLADAGLEIQSLGADVSMTCNALNQVHIALNRARGCRASTAAIDAAQETVARCKTIFDHMEAVHKSLQNDSQGRTGTTARIKWVLKKPRLRLMQQSLLSCVAMLQLMIASLNLSHDIANGTLAPDSAEETRRLSINAGLLLAQQAANQQLEAVEEEYQQSTADDHDDVFSSAEPDVALHRRIRSTNGSPRVARNRGSRIVAGEILRELHQPGELEQDDRPTSVVLQDLLHSQDDGASLYSSRWSWFRASSLDDTLDLSRELQQRWTADPRDDSDAECSVYSADDSLDGNQVLVPVQHPPVPLQRRPMSDIAVADRNIPNLPPEQEPGVLFTAMALYMSVFSHDRVVKEDGIPYLTYAAGAIFDVIGQTSGSALWLARNQHDQSRKVGWIWCEHFEKRKLQTEASASDEGARRSTNRHTTAPSDGKALVESQQSSTRNNAAKTTSKPACDLGYRIIASAIAINNIPSSFEKRRLAAHMASRDLPIPHSLDLRYADGDFFTRAIATFHSPQEATQVINYLDSTELAGNKLQLEHMKAPLTLRNPSAVGTIPIVPHTLTHTSDGKQIKIFETFKVAIDEPAWKVLPAALNKYNIHADWRQYSLTVVYDDLEHIVGLEEKPLVIFLDLDQEGKESMFMLRKLVSPTVPPAWMGR